MFFPLNQRTQKIKPTKPNQISSIPLALISNSLSLLSQNLSLFLSLSHHDRPSLKINPPPGSLTHFLQNLLFLPHPLSFPLSLARSLAVTHCRSLSLPWRSQGPSISLHRKLILPCVKNIKNKKEILGKDVCWVGGVQVQRYFTCVARGFSYWVITHRGGARIFCLGGPNFVTNILVSSQDKPSHSGINAHTQI